MTFARLALVVAFFDIMSFIPITTASTFQSTVILGTTTETRILEFKSEYRWQKPKYDHAQRAEQAEELCRDVAQFANTDGGTLLIGVTERDTTDGRKVADAIAPVADVDDFKQWIEQAIRNHLTPSTFPRSIDTIIAPSGGCVLAINIPPSLHLVALWLPNGKRGIEYLYRTDHGKEWMNPDEVERHIMNGSRAMQIELSRVLEEVSSGGSAGTNLRVALTPTLQKWVGGATVRGQPLLDEHDIFVKRGSSSDPEIELHINVKGAQIGCIRLPRGLIRHAWRTSDGNVGLCLDAAIVWRGGSNLGLEPLTGVP